MLSKQRVPEEQVPNDTSPLSTQHLFNIIYYLCRDLRSYWVEYSIIGFIEWHLSFLLCVKIEQCDERDFNYVLQEMRICVLPWKLRDTHWIELMFISEHSFIFVFLNAFQTSFSQKMNPISSILLDHEKSENNFSICFHVKMRKLVSTLCQRK